MEGVIADLAPDFTVKRIGIGGDVKQGYQIQGTAKKKTEHRQRGEVIGPALVRVNKNGTVELDISNFKPGEGGDRIYAVVGDFREWSAEVSSFPRDVAEMALAHVIENKVEAAYRRGDLFTKRGRMMHEWADYVNRQQAEVVPLNKHG